MIYLCDISERCVRIHMRGPKPYQDHQRENKPLFVLQKLLWPALTLRIGLPGSSALTGTSNVPVSAELPGRPIIRVIEGHITF